MRRSNWTPSIVPSGDDHNVYLVMDDLGRLGRVWREADDYVAELDAVILDFWPVNIKARSAWLPSTPPSNGDRTFPPTSPRSCAGAATCSSATFRSSCRISSIATRAAITPSGCRCRSAWSDMAFQRRKPPAIGVKAPFPGFIEPALATSIDKVPNGARWIHEIKFD